MTFSELLSRMSSKEISEWMAYYMIKDRPPSNKEEKQTVDDMKSVMMGLNPKKKGQ